MKTKKEKTKKFRNIFFWHDTLESIETQTIRKFILIVGIILFVMWILEILFFNVFYENVRMRELYQSSDEIWQICQNENYKEKLSDYAFQNDFSIIISKKTEDDFSISFSTFGVLEDPFVRNKIQRAIEKLKEEGDFVVFENQDLNTRGYLKTYEKNNIEYYIYGEIVYLPLTSTNEVFIRLLLLVSVIAFIIAMFFSYFLSRNLSEPILNISKKANLLVEGNLDISFSSNEYQEVKKLSGTLNFAISEIKKSQVIQKEVICNISHELKTPLTMIQSYAELINDISGDNKEKREEHLAVILEETKRLEYLVDDIMQYSKLESGLIDYNYTTFDLVKEVKKLEEFYKENYSQKGFEFIFDYAKEQVMIYADKNRIEQVIINFMNNAINYSTDKKIIKVHMIDNNGTTRLVIRDYGMGISEEDIKHIFDKHFRSIGAKRVSVGSGIGLSICKAILNEHNFKFGVESEINKGSAFYVDFPSVESVDKIIIN